ncbi:hypothetical protein R5R35_013242 [Gryllus longicercus]|uniref:Nuclease HARBI1 n=1 Tax=Gryllus longicercus TaxID=2509291 RepID=A0AAN9W5H3_9ORTH
MARQLRMMAFEDDSSDNEYYPPVGRPRWVKERMDLFSNYDDRDFVTRFCLSKALALFLLKRIEADLEYTSDRNACVSPMGQLLTTLRFYATGCSQPTMGNYMGASKSTIHSIIQRVSVSIASLREEFIAFPQGGRNK